MIARSQWKDGWLNLLVRISPFLSCIALALGTLFGATGASHAQMIFFAPVYAKSPPGAETGDYRAIHSVAIVSAIGTEFPLHTDHLFGSTKKVDISGWKVDDVAESLVRSDLRSRFTYVTATYDRAALAKIPNGEFTNSRDALRKYLHTVQADNVDAFVVIRPDLEGDAPGNAGLGFRNSAPTDSSSVLIWANYEVDIVDAKSFAIIGRSVSRRFPGDPGVVPYSGLVLTSDLKLDDKTLAPTAEQLDHMKSSVLFLVSDSLAQTLTSLKLDQ
jgi:hypothetical protein